MKFTNVVCIYDGMNDSCKNCIYSTGKRNKSKLSNQMQQWQEEMNLRFSGKKAPPKYWEYPELEKGNIHKHCAYCIDTNCPKTLNLDSLFTNENDHDNNEGEDYSEDYLSCSMKLCPWGCGANYHSCKSTEHLLICAAYEEPGEFDWISRGVSNFQFQNSKTKNEKSVRRKKKLSKQKAVESKSKSIGDLYHGPGRPASETLKEKLKLIQPVPPETLLKHQSVTRNGLSLDINVERPAKHQVKPLPMYSFVCGKSFRRNEYHNHIKNIHDDIMGGIDNWIEHRCPLASYGCEYSSRLLNPRSPSKAEPSWRRNIIFSSGTDSFGTNMVQFTRLKSIENETKHNENIRVNDTISNIAFSCFSKKEMLDLPDEILYEIIDYLEPFR